jgi:hypothetical protein
MGKKLYKVGLAFFFSLTMLIMTEVFSQSSSGQPAVKQGKPVPASFCIKEREIQVYELVNQYRKSHNLPPIPLSKSLCHVAALHLRDLVKYHPDEGPCNFHSWSDKGNWKPICYPRDESKKNSVWDKPRELTTYPGKGYEIIYWENSPLVIDTILKVWKTEDYFNDYLLNTGKWLGHNWEAIGIAISENYASAWFGEEPDPEGIPSVCGQKPARDGKDSTASGVSRSKDQKSQPEKAPGSKPGAGETSKPAKEKTLSTSPPGLASPSEAKKTSKVNGVSGEGKTNLVPVAGSDSSVVFYIIVRTNISKEAAGKLIVKLKAEGYSDAKYHNTQGKTRISVFETKNRQDALNRLKEVKKVYKDAWLLKLANSK